MNVAFIPVRGGSKSIPLKNVKEIAGKPLVYWTAKAANDCQDIDVVYISTDNEEIRKTVESFELTKVQVVERSNETATDTATTESAMMEFANKYYFDNIVLIQATSPLLTSRDLSGGFQLFELEDTDSVLSVVRQKRFIWNLTEDSYALPDNYNPFNRPRRQEFEGYFVENGAFYITSRQALLKSKNRVSGKIRVYEMDEKAYYEIDEPNDWLIVEKQLEERTKKNVLVPDIKMFLTDCDGCLTDGGMYYSEHGDELKKFSALDGMGFAILRKKGIITGIITSEKMELNRRRCQKLKLDIYEEGIIDKLDVVKRICREHGIDLKNVAYVGDDINDLDVIREVGFGCSVANGVQIVREAARYVTKTPGGKGAVREVVDMIMKEQ